MDLRSLLLWDVKRTSPAFLVFVAILVLIFVFVGDHPQSTRPAIVVKRLGPEAYFVGFDPSFDAAQAGFSSDDLLAAAERVRSKTGLTQMTPYYAGPRLSAIMVTREIPAKGNSGDQ